MKLIVRMVLVVVFVGVVVGFGMAQAAQGPGAGPQPSKMMAADAHPAFEVATIKPSDPDDESDGFSTNGRHVSVRNQSVSKILAAAYGIHVRQVVDGSPDQEGSEHGTQTASKFTNTSMADFAFIMQFFLDRPMVDQTGLTGRYD